MANVRRPTLASEAAKHGVDYLRKWKKLQVCTNCGRRVRPSNGTAKDWPVTVSYGSTELCITCKQNPNPTKGEPERAERPKNVSPGAALRQQDGVKPAPRARVRFGEKPPKTRQQIAEEWSPAERSVALLVCEHASDAAEAADIMGSLGLFQDKDLMPILNNLSLDRVGRTPSREGIVEFGP